MKKQRRHMGTHVFLAILAVSVLVPFLYIVLMAFGKNVSGVSALFPEEYTLDNFRKLLREHQFVRWLTNSLLLSGFTMCLSVILTSVTVYIMSRLKFAGKTYFFNGILLIQIFPLSLSMVSINKIFAEMGMLNKLWGLVLVDSVIASIGLVLLAKGFFDSIPYELDEAAMMDGANLRQVLWHVILPLVKPMLAIVAVQSFVLSYNEYVIASVVMTNGFESMPLAVGLQSLIAGQYGTNWGIYCATAVIGSLPMVILFYSLQKYFIAGLTEGGVKF